MTPVNRPERDLELIGKRVARFRFGVFEVDPQAHELHKSGLKVRIQEQPFQVLVALLERPGKVVSREELQRRVWGDTFVDFEHSLSVAVSKLRDILGDSADKPRFIETLHGRGYRFIYPVQTIDEERGQPPPPDRSRWLAAAAVVLAIIAIAVGPVPQWLRQRLFPPRPGAGSPQAELRITPFTTSLGYEGEPAISPNGELVAFVKSGDIYVQAVGSETPVQRTDTPESESSPAWSPDSRELAFCREGKAGFTIHVMEKLAGPERNLGESTGCELDWSPIGEFLAVAVEGFRPEGPGGIYSLSLGTRETRTLTSPPPGYRDGGPAFSPDGRTLAFSRWRDWWASEIYLLPLGPDGAPTGEPKRLTFRHLTWFGGFAWAADGLSIVFVEWPPRDLWRIPVSGGEPERLNVGENLREPSISRQGNRLVCGKQEGQLNIYRVPGPNATGEAAAGKGGSPERLISSTANDDFPRFSPDGEKIAFASTRSGRSQIWKCDSDGSNEVRVKDALGGWPSWSPDGRWIAFTSSSEEPGNTDIYVVSAEGGEPRRLTFDDLSDRNPSWSQDGKWIYFESSRTGDWQIWRIPSEGGTAEPVTRNGGRSARESADGRFLYYTKPEPTPGIWKAPVAGGEETKVLDPRGQWDLLKDGICFMEGPRGAIKFFRFASGQIELVTELPEGKNRRLGFAVSPDGRWVLYTQVEQYEIDLVLVENFH